MGPFSLSAEWPTVELGDIISLRNGYPPDMQLLATETVLKQAEMIADELAS